MNSPQYFLLVNNNNVFVHFDWNILNIPKMLNRKINQEAKDQKLKEDRNSKKRKQKLNEKK